MLYTKDMIREAARAGVIDVQFTKKDGSLREMRCSLQEQYLPPLMGEAETKDNPDVLAVWDLEAKGWRSFRIDSVLIMETIND
jgi:WYL_2, Sm-like SH3 beta-barrel fold